MNSIICRSPMRVSLLGGGTDKKEWFRENGGHVISFALNQYVYVTLRELPKIYPFKFRIVTSKIEEVNSIDDISHPLIRAVFSCHAREDCRFEVIYNADLPGSSGMGSSSAFCASLIMAVNTFYGKHTSKHSLARDAIQIEREVLNEAGGWQDQIATVFGGLNSIRFWDEDFSVDKIVFSDYWNEVINKRSLLVFTRFTRYAHDVELQKKDIHSQYYMDLLNEVKGLIDEYENGDLCKNFSLPQLLDSNWKNKKKYYPASSNQPIQEIERKIRSIGVAGMKLLGAGSGGFFYTLFNNSKQKEVFMNCYEGTDIIVPKVCNDGTQIILC